MSDAADHPDNLNDFMKFMRGAMLDRFLRVIDHVSEKDHFDPDLNFGEQFNGIVWIAAETGVISHYDAERFWNAMMYLANNKEGFDNSDGDRYARRCDNVRRFVRTIYPTFVAGDVEPDASRDLFTYAYANEHGRYVPEEYARGERPRPL